MHNVGPRFGLSYEIASVKTVQGKIITETDSYPGDDEGLKAHSVKELVDMLHYSSTQPSKQFQEVDPEYAALVKECRGGYEAWFLGNPLKLVTGQKVKDYMEALWQWQDAAEWTGKQAPPPEAVAGLKQQADRLKAELEAEKPVKRIHLTMTDDPHIPTVSQVVLEAIPQAE